MDRSRIRLLLVDDYDTSDSPAQRLARAVASVPLGLEIVTDANKAIEALRVAYFDAVLIHWDLSDPRSSELLQRMAALVVAPTTIVLTAETDTRRELHAVRLGVTDFVDPAQVGAEGFSRLLRNAILRNIVIDSLRDESILDPVTGVKSRAYFNEVYETELERAARLGHHCVLVAIHVANIRNINRTYDHVTGDLALATVAKTCAGTLRQSDTFARYNGDGFRLLLTDTDKPGARPAIKRIRSDLSDLTIRRESDRIPIDVRVNLSDPPI